MVRCSCDIDFLSPFNPLREKKASKSDLFSSNNLVVLLTFDEFMVFWPLCEI